VPIELFTDRGSGDVWSGARVVLSSDSSPVLE